MINNILARVGFGGAKVDTKIENRIYSPGEIVKGVVQITGGNSAQKVRKIDLLLCTKVKFKEEHVSLSPSNELVLARAPVAGGLEIKSQQNSEVPFEIQLPLEAPLTEWQGMSLFCELYLRTELDLERAIDASDIDRLKVGPLPVQQCILDALINLGFRYQKAELELGRMEGSHTYYQQQIEFRGSPRYLGLIDELEVSFIPRQLEMEVIFKLEGHEIENSGWVSERDDELIRFDVDYADFEDIDWEEGIEAILNSRLSQVFAQADSLIKSRLETPSSRNFTP
jgi:sporulation-control protein